MKKILAVTFAALLSLATGSAQGQEGDLDLEDHASPRGVYVGLLGGITYSSPRGVFPSVRVGDSSARAVGPISSRTYGMAGVGSRIGLEVIIPFTDALAVGAGFGTQIAIVRFEGDTGRPETRLDLQTLQASLMLQGNVYRDLTAFGTTGLRTVYVGGGLDVDVLTVANRYEGAIWPDTTGDGIPKVGSFDRSQEPFRRLVAVRGVAGLRYGLQDHLELQAEAGYNFTLNSLFSSLVVPDNDFTIDNLLLQVGLGYRF